MDKYEQVDNVFHNDSVYMKSLVGKEVELKTIDGKTLLGIIYVIDPIFKTVVLHTNFRNEKDFQTIFVFHHAIEFLKIVSDEVEDSYVKEDNKNRGTDQSTRKRMVKKWLKQMLIDVNESGDYLKIEDHLVIVPPYEPANCICNNTMILERTQKVLQQMPQEYS
ncbi:uncharacterized protein [Leptinotarsa decemlineata]|uniref:uncharacterized protein n=1 Tax=Leptinotarsa decemlineata TaxID=7539 RepID=UPI000C2528FE|nr:uncharacterized protein LOC111511400 [Leptinotarsa decemlineata]